jgi:hypothetical protein
MTHNNFCNFVDKMYDRLEQGSRQYGEAYLGRDLMKDIEEELLDIANYAYLQYIKLKLFKEVLNDLSSK